MCWTVGCALVSCYVGLTGVYTVFCFTYDVRVFLYLRTYNVCVYHYVLCIQSSFAGLPGRPAVS